MCNDSSVYKVDRDVLVSPEAYVLFYVRRGVTEIIRADGSSNAAPACWPGASCAPVCNRTACSPHEGWHVSPGGERKGGRPPPRQRGHWSACRHMVHVLGWHMRQTSAQVRHAMVVLGLVHVVEWVE